MKKNQYMGKVIIGRILLGFVLMSAFCILPGIEKASAAEVPELKATDLDRINPGTTAPDFNLESVEGTRVKLSSYRNKKNVVLIFYRGYW
jgi:AhpC/TSA family